MNDMILIDRHVLSCLSAVAAVAVHDLKDGLEDGTYDDDCIDGWQSDAIQAAIDAADAVIEDANPLQAKADRLRSDAKALDTGMDPRLVRELHSAADALDGAAVVRAARDLVDAYGGNVPDWLQAEFGALENALAGGQPAAEPYTSDDILERFDAGEINDEQAIAELQERCWTERRARVILDEHKAR